MGVVGSNGRSRKGAGSGRRPPRSRTAAPSPNGGEDSFRLTIPSDFHAGREVQKRIVDDVTRMGFTSQSQFGIKVALEEALINAIKHGNREHPRKKVRIEVKATPKQLEITIEDEGPGFSRKSVPDPTLKENLEKCTGRGILLIEAYMTSAKWSHGGRRLKMIKKNEPDVLPRS
jgi:serine/threonine-protein kinase RsbW